MNKITPQNVHLFNENVRFEDPLEIVRFVLDYSEQPIVTTSFGSYSAAILHVVTRALPEIPVIWCDTGYNTKATYRHAKRLIDRLHLNVDIFTPKYTTAYMEVFLGKPSLDNPDHGRISDLVKLNPFDEALEKYQPDVWFTNLRKHQTEHRDHLDVFSFSTEGILKVSPFYHFDDKALKEYMDAHKLPMEFDYYDPVKALENRECGIHLKH